MYSGCGGYCWYVNVGGDHSVTGTCANASGGGRRVAASGVGTDARTGSDDDADCGGADPPGQRVLLDYRPQVPSARTVSDRDRARTPAAIDDRDFREFVRERSRALLRAAYLLTGNRADAEDLVQSVLAKTYLAWDRIEDRAALDGYVRRAMVNTHISWWRRRRVEEFPTDEVPDQAVADQSAGSDMQEPLRRAIARLPQRMRDAVMLRYYEDMTEAEVAEVLGVSLGTVKSTVSRAVAKLRIDADLQPE
jgi:RNA polymerase sigma-70 factor (sigma-E family)